MLDQSEMAVLRHMTTVEVLASRLPVVSPLSQ
jgi:hypothetical protein